MRTLNEYGPRAAKKKMSKNEKRNVFEWHGKGACQK